MPLAGRLTSRGFGRSVAVLASGTAIAQAIGVVVSPLLTRQYTPEAFGAFGVFLAIVSLTTVGVGLRYEAAIPLAGEDAEAAAVLILTLGIVAGLSLVAALVVWLVIEVGAGGRLGHLEMLLWLVPPALLLAGIHQALTFWATRTEAFAASARASVAQSASQGLTQVALGVVGGGSGDLTLGHLIGRASAVAALLPVITSAHRALIRRLSVPDVRRAAAEFRRFPLIALWSSLVNAASFHVPVLILAGLFQATVVGWFLLTVRVLQVPLAVVGTAVGQVFYSRASRASDTELRSTTSQVFRALVTLGVGPMVLLAIGGEDAFALAFGDQWRGAGEYAQWLAPWLLIVFVASPLSTLVFVLSRQREELLFQLLLGGARAGALLVGWWLGDAGLAIGLFGATSAALWGLYLAWLLEISGAGLRAPLTHLARNLAVALLLAIPVVAANLLDIRGLAWALVAGIVLGVMLIRSALQLDFSRQ